MSDPTPDSAYLDAALVPGDVTGSRLEGSAPVTADGLRGCMGGVAPSARAAVVRTDLYEIEHCVDVFADDSAARKVIARYDDSKKVAGCIADQLRPRILDGIRAGDGDPASVTIGTVRMTRHPSPNIGDRSMSMRLTIPIREEGRAYELSYYADVVAARHGRVVAMLVAVGAPYSDRYTLEGYLRTVMARLP